MISTTAIPPTAAPAMAPAGTECLLSPAESLDVAVWGTVVEGVKDTVDDVSIAISPAELLVAVAMLVGLASQPNVIKESRRMEYCG